MTTTTMDGLDPAAAPAPVTTPTRDRHAWGWRLELLITVLRAIPGVVAVENLGSTPEVLVKYPWRWVLILDLDGCAHGWSALQLLSQWADELPEDGILELHASRSIHLSHHDEDPAELALQLLSCAERRGYPAPTSCTCDRARDPSGDLEVRLSMDELFGVEE